MAKAVVAREVSFMKFRKFIIPEPVDPLIEVLAKAMQPNVLSSGKMYAEQFRAALAKIGGKVVFEGEGE